MKAQELRFYRYEGHILHCWLVERDGGYIWKGESGSYHGEAATSSDLIAEWVREIDRTHPINK